MREVLCKDEGVLKGTLISLMTFEAEYVQLSLNGQKIYPRGKKSPVGLLLYGKGCGLLILMVLADGGPKD